MASGGIHLIGSFLVFSEWYTLSAYTFRDNPKSATFTSLPSQTRTFLAAKSRCTNPLHDRNPFEKYERQRLVTITGVVKEKANNIRSVKKAIKAQSWYYKFTKTHQANFHIMHVVQLVPFPSRSAMRTSLGQRVWQNQRHVSCQYHSCYSLGLLLHIRFSCWCTEQKTTLIIFIKVHMTKLLLFAWWNPHVIVIFCF